MPETKKSIKTLIIGLYAILGASMGNRSREIKEAALDAELRPWFDEITYLKEAVAEVARGKSFKLPPLGQSLKEFVAEYSKDPKSTPVSVAILRGMSFWMRAGNENAWKVLETNSNHAAFPSWVPSMFSKKVKSQAPMRTALESLVSTLTGKRSGSIMLTLEQSAAAKSKYPELYKEYLQLRRSFNDNWKQAMAQFVRDSGARMVDFTDLEAFFKKSGIESTMPSGFTGKIDAVGKVYTTDGELIAGGLPSKVMFPKVLMNEEGRGDWVFQAIRPTGEGANYFYRQSTVMEKRQKKFGIVDDLVGKIDGIRSRWVQGIKGFGEDVPQTVAAVVLELLYTFSARIGSKGNAAGGEPTYGLGTLLCKQITIQPKGFVMKYKGKDGVNTKHVYKATDAVSKMVIAAVTSLAKGKKPSEPLFTYQQKNGSRVQLPPNVVNKVFRALGAGQATVHKLRTLRGTTIFKEAAEQLYAKKTSMDNSAEAIRYFKEIAIEVGKALNHVRRSSDGSATITATTAIASYIDFAAQVEFFRYYNLPLPVFLAKRTSNGIEASTDELVEEFDLDAGLIEDWLSGEDELV
jgi:hypothetical protein